MRKTAKKLKRKTSAQSMDAKGNAITHTRQQTTMLTICKRVDAIKKKRIKQIHANITRFSLLFIVFIPL